jgi:hypothetical protein
LGQATPSAKEPVIKIQGKKTSTGGMDILLQDPEMSIFYQKGGYLIYDCIEKHWVCTAKPEHERCIAVRKNSISDNDPKLPCASIKKFISHEVCIKSQKEMVDWGIRGRFCKHPTINKNEMTF